MKKNSYFLKNSFVSMVSTDTVLTDRIMRDEKIARATGQKADSLLYLGKRA